MGYTGNIYPIILAQGSLNGDKNIARVPSYDYLDATNVSMDQGFMQKAYGEAKLNSADTLASAIVGGTEYYPAVSTQVQVIATADGKLLKATGVGTTYATELKTGLGSDKMTTFCSGGEEYPGADRKLFCFNGYNVVQVLTSNNSTTSDIASPPADWTGNVQPVAGIIHDGRLFAWGAYPNMLYYSTIDNHENFVDYGSGLFPVEPGVGSKITKVLSAFGYLYIWKDPQGIFQLDPLAEIPSLNTISTNLGMSSPRAAVLAAHDIWFQSSVGSIHRLSAVDTFADVKDSDVGATYYLDQILNVEIDKTRLDRAVMVYDQERKRILLSNTSNGGTRNNVIIVIDINDPSRPKFHLQKAKGTYETLWLQRDLTSKTLKERPVSGGSDGFVYNLVSSTLEQFNSSFQTAYTDLSPGDPTSKLASINKHFDFLEPVITPTGNYNLNVNVYIDGKLKDTVAFDLGGTGVELGSFMLDQDVLGSDELDRNRKKRLEGCYGRRISVRGYNNNATQNYKVSQFLLHWRPGEERISEGE